MGIMCPESIHMSNNTVIVSRHSAAIGFIAAYMGGGVSQYGETVHLPDGITIPVLRGNVTPDDVRGKVVYGNLPMGLAALAEEVHAVEFAGAPPRGQDLNLGDMVRAGARIATYKVTRAEATHTHQHPTPSTSTPS